MSKNISPDLVPSGRNCPVNLGIRSCPVRKLICPVRLSPILVHVKFVKRSVNLSNVPKSEIFVYFTKNTINKIIPASIALKLSQQLLQLASMLKLSNLKISPSHHGMLVELTKLGYFGVITFTNMSG